MVPADAGILIRCARDSVTARRRCVRTATVARQDGSLGTVSSPAGGQTGQPATMLSPPDLNQQREIAMRFEVRTVNLRSFVAIAAIGGAVALWAAPALAQQKTVRQCTEEWRANKAENQAKRITLQSYVTQCRAGGSAAQPSTTQPSTAQPSAPAAPRTAAPAARTNPPPSPRPRETTAVAPAGQQFANEAQARARCPSDTVVWVNEKSRIYHFSGSKNYGNTKEGTYMCEKDAVAAGERAAKNEKRP
jgi:hypothetical protein